MNVSHVYKVCVWECKRVSFLYICSSACVSTPSVCVWCGAQAAVPTLYLYTVHDMSVNSIQRVVFWERYIR